MAGSHGLYRLALFCLAHMEDVIAKKDTGDALHARGANATAGQPYLHGPRNDLAVNMDNMDSVSRSRNHWHFLILLFDFIHIFFPEAFYASVKKSHFCMGATSGQH